MFRRYVCVLFALAIFHHTLHGQTIVAPNAFAGTDGNSGTGVPIQASGQARTYQVQYAASQFTGVPIGASFTALRWRLDQGLASSYPPSIANWANYDITLAQATNSMAGFSSNFAGNMTNPVLVRSGALSFAANSFPNSGTPPNFGTSIVFATPYVYQGGDLVLHLTHTGSSIATVSFFDAIDDNDANYGSNFRAQFALGYQATNSTGVDFQALVTQLQFSIAVPEPTTWALLALAGGAGLYAARRYRRSRASTLNETVELPE